MPLWPVIFGESWCAGDGLIIAPELYRPSSQLGPLSTSPLSLLTSLPLQSSLLPAFSVTLTLAMTKYCLPVWGYYGDRAGGGVDSVLITDLETVQPSLHQTKLSAVWILCYVYLWMIFCSDCYNAMTKVCDLTNIQQCLDRLCARVLVICVILCV